MTEEGMRTGTRLTRLMKNRLGDLWEGLEDLWKVEVQEAMEDLGNLLILQVSEPENPIVGSELAHAKARVANWTFVGADKVRDEMKMVLKEVLSLVGALVKGFIK